MIFTAVLTKQCQLSSDINQVTQVKIATPVR